jgi:glycosyltransferase 2 family protein
MSSMLRNPRTWLGIAISVVALYFAVRGVSWRDLWAQLVGADYFWLLPAVVAIVAGQVARAVRWQVLFGSGPRPSLSDSFAILSIGYMVSALFPLRLGDWVRAWLVETRTPAGGAAALATVLVERAIDFLTVVLVLAVWVPVPASRLLQTAFGAGSWAAPGNLRLAALLIVVAVYATWVLLSLVSDRAGRTVSRALARVGMSADLARRAGALTAAFLAGFAPLRNPRTGLLAAGWSIVVWLLGGLACWLAMRSFHLYLPFAAAVFALCATALFAVLPSSPGYVGVYHSATRLGLVLYGGVYGLPVSIPAVVSYAIVLHGVTMIVLIVLGVVGLGMVGLSGSELSRHLGQSEAVP